MTSPPPHPIDGSALLGTTTLASVFRLNTRLFRNCLSSLSPEHALQRPNERTNSIAFIACHLVDSRHFIARFLGLEESNPLERFLADASGIDEIEVLPGLDEIVAAWKAISPVLDACITGLSEAELRAPSPQRFPVDQPTVFAALGFLLQHESYHVGQLALLRKFLGYPAMKYG